MDVRFPDTNFGTGPQLRADLSPFSASYLRFPVAGLSGVVLSARLRLWVAEVSVDGPRFFATDAGWQERTLTFASRPAPVGPVLDDLGACAPSTWVELDVTAAVAGNGTVAFVLEPTSGDAVHFDSRETDRPPELTVVTEAGACGDGTCDASESCGACPADCGACPSACGDGTCNGTETCSSCPADCGACPCTELFDDFTGPILGPSWQVASGAFSVSGGAALGTAKGSYAFWTGAPAADSSVAVTLGAATAPTYAGVIARADPSQPASDHYAAYLDPGGMVGLARRTDWSYTFLGTGPTASGGAHEIGLTASGSGPVTLTVTLDGAPVIAVTDASPQSLTAAGSAGMFDHGGASRPLQAFTVSCAPSPSCGDGTCNGGETCTTCPSDCGACPEPVCYDLSCDPGETCETCPSDCGACPGTCGDLVCDPGETCSTCMIDCGPCPGSACGDRFCNNGETCGTCPFDCNCSPSCGDGTCAETETCSACPADCGKCEPTLLSCGDGTCRFCPLCGSYEFESCATCPADCGKCKPTP